MFATTMLVLPACRDHERPVSAEAAAPGAIDAAPPLAQTLDPGGPTVGIERAVVAAKDLGHRPTLEARIRDLSESKAAPRALGAMLRALSDVDRRKAAELACAAATKHARTPFELSGDERHLVESAMWVVARAGARCPFANDVLVHERCVPEVRCDASGKPLDGRGTTTQNEPVCTKDALAAAVEREAKRTVEDVVLADVAPRPTLFALAVATAANDVPAAFVRAHARRRYAVAQPAEPACDGAVVGASCHCDEATMRDEACRRDEAGPAHVGICRFVVDDAGKRITKVVASAPP